jgi:TolB-like protein/Tfp pilus assembly protein PilF
MQLNAQHPGWYRFSIFLNAYRKKDYKDALDVALKINMPTYFFTHASLASVYGQLGDQPAARQAVRDLLTQKPDFAATAREDWGHWLGPGELLEHLLDGLRKAGLEVDEAGRELTDRDPSEQATTAEATESIAIAVLPFTDMSSAKDQDYFCEGMAEEIMNALVHVDGIRVASRTSAFQAVEEGKDLQAIGRALSVGQVLEGSVRIAGSRLRVTAQLTEIESGYQLWSERYDREAADVFAIQDEIAVGVVEAVKARLGSGEHTVPSRVQVGNLEAYQLYLKGRHYRYSKNDHASALTCFEEAVAIDPEHAPSWAGLAEATILASVYSLVPILEAYQTAKDSLAIALDLQGESAEGCYVEGMIAFCEARWQDAEEALRRAVEFQPTFVQAHCWLGFLFSVLCRREEAESAFATARELDPLAAYPYAMTACGRITSGLPREAIDDAGQAMTFDHENTLALYCSGIAKVATGAFQEGVEELKKAAQHSRRGAFILGIFGWGLAAGGRIKEAEAILEELESRPKPAPTVVTEAWIRAALGDFEGAWEVLGRAEEEHQAILYFAGMPPFDPLRADPRFDALLERLGLPPTPSAQPVDSPVGIGEIAEKSIAVLPFVNRSGNPDDEYFSDGLSEELINALSRIPGLKVTARSSAFQFRWQELDVRDVGRKLGVATVLEGSVRISGSRLRITAELVNCADGYQIWSERFDREMTDIFDTQDEIARAIVAKLHVEIDGAREEPLVVVGTENMEAYRLYLKARYLRGKEDHDGARRVFEEAIRLDPSFAPSWTGLAEINGLAAHFNLIPAREGCAAARKALTTAAALQGESADALHVEGLVAFIERRWAAMEAAWRRALELQPTHVLALGGFGLSLCTRQRLDEALPFLERARQADPLASFPYARTAVGFLANGRPEEGLRYAEDALTFEKEDVTALFASCMANVALGRLEEGIEAAEHAVALSRRGVVFLGLLGWALATAGRNGEARAILKELRARPAASPAVVSEAWLLGALGEIDVAFDVLARAEEEYQAFLNYTGMPAFDPLRADPRFAALVERFGLSSPPSAAQAKASPSEVSPELPRLAVLPFVDHSCEQDQEWFAAGTHEALLTTLQKIKALRVTSRTSSMRYRETALSMPEISEELHVRWLVEGSVTRAGDQMRVSASLIDGTEDQQVWSGRFERDISDILALQSEVARAIADEIRVTLTPEEKGLLAEAPRVDPAAYRAYVLGLHRFDRVTPVDFRRSVELFEEAVSIDDAFVPAHAALVFAHGIAVEYGWIPRDEASGPVTRSLKATRTLSPDSGEALHSLANYQFHMEKDLEAAERTYRSAMQKTSNAYVRFELGWLLSRMGRHGDAVAVLEEAVLLDPRSPLIRCDLGWWLYGARDYDRAIEEARFALEIDPTFPESHWLLAAVYAQQGRFGDSLAEYELYESLYGEPVLWFRGYLLGLAGRREEALQILDELEQLDPSGGEVAQIHLGLGDHEKVIEALEKADAPGVWFQPHLWPEYEALHGEPRFRAILDKFSIPLSEVQG